MGKIKLRAFCYYQSLIAGIWWSLDGNRRMAMQVVVQQHSHSVRHNILKLLYFVIIVVSNALVGSISCDAKSYPFKINKDRNVSVAQSSTPGTKIVRVVSYARNAKKAIELALQDAVYATVFTGLSGNAEFEYVPPILLDGSNDYSRNKKYFDKFFKNGEFLSYAHLANSEFPSGLNNVSSPKGRKVTVYVVVDYARLLTLFNNMGLKTYTGIFETL